MATGPTSISPFHREIRCGTLRPVDLGSLGSPSPPSALQRLSIAFSRFRRGGSMARLDAVRTPERTKPSIKYSGALGSATINYHAGNRARRLFLLKHSQPDIRYE